MTHVNRAIFLGIIFGSFAGGSLALADSHWSGNSKITVTGKSSNAGTINFRISFAPGEDGNAADPQSIEVLVSDRSAKSEVAQIIANNLGATLAAEKLRVARSGNSVTVKAKRDGPRFAIEMTSSSVQGVSLKIDD